MMKSLIAAAAVLMAVSLPAAAQDAVDPAALEVVTTAVTNTLATPALRVDTQSQTEISGLPDGMSFGQQQTSIYDLVQAAEGWNAAGSSTTALVLPNAAIEITVESVLLDGVLYLRQTSSGAEGLQLPEGQEQPQVTIPEGWFNAADLMAQMPEGTTQANTDPAQFASTLVGSLALPINAESVTALSELPADTIDGQSMRVFQLTLDPAAVIESSAAGLLNAGMMGGFGGQGGGQFQPPQGAPADAQAPAGTPNPEDAQVTFAVYVGADDGLVHRIYSVIALAADGTSPGLTITTLTNYIASETPAAITAPEIGS